MYVVPSSWELHVLEKKKKKTIYFVFASDAAKPLETHTEILLQVFNHKNFFHHCVHVNPEARLFALL